jgi:NADH:ubiquinone oxidoreductase subunit
MPYSVRAKQDLGRYRMGFFSKVFTWWNDSTVGTDWFTRRKGVKVGEDDEGNRYYKERNGPRRWIMYKGEVNASRIPPDWHGWLHYTVDLPPTEAPPVVKPWEQHHQPNLTGTEGAYYPPGSLYEGGRRRPATGDYEPWTPE